MVKLTKALEDYLETLYKLHLNNNNLRVKDVVKIKKVKAASVSQALKRLASLNLINYKERHEISFTEKGFNHAAKLNSYYNLIYNFLTQILDVSNNNAKKDACLIEHALSFESSEKLTRFFEYINICNKEKLSFLNAFKTCSLVNPEFKKCSKDCHIENKYTKTLLSYAPNIKLSIDHISMEKPKYREALIKKGFIPGVRLIVLNNNSRGSTVLINNFKVNLKINELKLIYVKKLSNIKE